MWSLSNLASVAGGEEGTSALDWMPFETQTATSPVSSYQFLNSFKTSAFITIYHPKLPCTSVVRFTPIARRPVE